MNNLIEHKGQKIKNNDFIYLDPPYYPIKRTSWVYSGNDSPDILHIQLKNYCDELTGKGIKFLLSNSDTKFTRELFSCYNIKIVGETISINSKSNKRGKVDCLLITNFDDNGLKKAIRTTPNKVVIL